MQGDCSASTVLPVPPPGVALAPVSSSQCLIITTGDLFRLETAGQRLVIDNLVVRISRADAGASAAVDGVPTLVSVTAAAARLWITNTVFQGDAGAGRVLTVADATASVYLGDARVANFDLSETPAVTTDGPLRIVDSALTNNGAAVPMAGGAAPLVFGSSSATVALEGASFEGNAGSPLGQSNGVPVVRHAFLHMHAPTHAVHACMHGPEYPIGARFPPC